jgi:putative membrane protein
MIILAVLLIVFIIWVAGRGEGGWRMSDWGVGGTRRDPLEIAKERYAKGEITRDQFEEIKRNLMS